MELGIAFSRDCRDLLHMQIAASTLHGSLEQSTASVPISFATERQLRMGDTKDFRDDWESMSTDSAEDKV